ncbi:MAG: hypothetical protein ACK4L8_13115 [Nitrincola lacisaponensis]|uniref:hypothetical protein n=1 Tax=Nitrincola lacisaponensis TaxID=267850 RepID=UPI00391CCECD
MKSKMLFSGALVVFLGVSSIIFYAISQMSIQHLILCSSNESGTRIPSGLCNYYMLNFRANESDINDLSSGAGLDYILNLEGPNKYKIAEIFISRGLDVNGVNHFSNMDVTPLHASVLYNDVERVVFLIKQGADVNIRSEGYEMTALELAEKLHEDNDKEDRSEIIRILSSVSHVHQ